MALERYYLIFAASLLIPIYPTVAAEPLSVLLEKGIYAEETLGDLDQAIRIYGQISAKSKAERPIAAQAQFRQGQCLLAKGDQARAAAAFRALISDYPDQKDLVAEAEKLLSDLRAASQNPPAVLETQPRAFDDAVPATLREIRVTFDQKMKDDCCSWAFAGAATTPIEAAETAVGGSFGGSMAFARAGGPEPPTVTPREPRLTGQPRYDNKKTTCSVPTELRPGTVYRLEINVSPSAGKFQSAQGTAAQPYVILFATQDKNGKPTPIPDDLASAAKAVNERNRDLDRIRADICLLRHFTIIWSYEEWIGAIYRLAQDGKRAVPELAMELMRHAPNDHYKRRAVAFTLRAIGDPRAVPTLIQELNRTPPNEESDCEGLTTGNEAWLRFMIQHQATGFRTFLGDIPAAFCFLRPVCEITTSLEKITGHSEGHDHADDTSRAQALKNRQEAARRWQGWWAGHAGEFLKPEELAEIKRWPELAKKDPIEAAGLRVWGPTIPTGPEYSFGPEKELTIRARVQNRDEPGGWSEGAIYVDLDTGRSFANRPNKGWEMPWDIPTRAKVGRWDEERGIDLEVRSSGDIDSSHITVYNGLGWRLGPGEWETLPEIIRKPEPLKLSGPDNGRGFGVEWKGESVRDAFLFRLREGGIALVKIQSASPNEWSVMLRYRMLCRKNTSSELIPLGRRRSAPIVEESMSPTTASSEAGEGKERLSTRPVNLSVQDWSQPLDEAEHQRALELADRILMDRFHRLSKAEKEKGWVLMMCSRDLRLLASLDRAGTRDLLLDAIDPEGNYSSRFLSTLYQAGDTRASERIQQKLNDKNVDPAERLKWLWVSRPAEIPPEVEDYMIHRAFEHFGNGFDKSERLGRWCYRVGMVSHSTERSRKAIEERLLAEISNKQAMPEVCWPDVPSRLCEHRTPGPFRESAARWLVKALIQINNPASKDVLLRVVREGPPNCVRACAAMGLHHFGNDAEKKLAVNALRDIHRQMKWEPAREEYAFLMASLGDSYGLQQLRGFMRHKDASIRGQAYVDLQTIGDRSFISIAANDYPHKDFEPNDFERILNWGDSRHYDEEGGRLVLHDCVCEYLYEVFGTAKNPTASSRALTSLLEASDEKLKPILPRCSGVLAEPIPEDVLVVPYSKDFFGQMHRLVALLRVGTPEEQRRAMERLAELFAIEAQLNSRPTMIVNMLCYSRYKPAQRLLLHVMESYPPEPPQQEGQYPKPDVSSLAEAAFLIIETGQVGMVGVHY